MAALTIADSSVNDVQDEITSGAHGDDGGGKSLTRSRQPLICSLGLTL